MLFRISSIIPSGVVPSGSTSSAAIRAWTSGVRNFHSAGKVQASTDPRDMRLQRMLGHISALGHQKPESVLVVVDAGTRQLALAVDEVVGKQ